MKQLIVILSFCVLLLSCTTSEMKNEITEKSRISVIFKDIVKNESVKQTPNVSFKQIQDKFASIIQSADITSTGVFNVIKINNITSNGVEVVYEASDGSVSNFLYFDDIDLSTLLDTDNCVFQFLENQPNSQRIDTDSDDIVINGLAFVCEGDCHGKKCQVKFAEKRLENGEVVVEVNCAECNGSGCSLKTIISP